MTGERLALGMVPCPYDIGQNLAVDLKPLGMLGARQLSLSPGIHVEAPLPFIYPAFLMGMRNCLGVNGALDVIFDALNSLEDEIGRQVRELLYAAVPNNGGVVVPSVPEKANFNDRKVTTQTSIWLVLAPEMLKPPLKFCLIPRVCLTEVYEP